MTTGAAVRFRADNRVQRSSVDATGEMSGACVLMMLVCTTVVAFLVSSSRTAAVGFEECSTSQDDYVAADAQDGYRFREDAPDVLQVTCRAAPQLTTCLMPAASATGKSRRRVMKPRRAFDPERGAKVEPRSSSDDDLLPES